MKKYAYFFLCFMLMACEAISENKMLLENKFFKILTPIEWQNFQKEKVFPGSCLDQQDGFIHLSLSHQWNRIWQKFFDSGECYLLEIDGSNLIPELLRIEANRPGGEQYPHYYGNILLSSIIEIEHICQ